MRIGTIAQIEVEKTFPEDSNRIAFGKEILFEAIPKAGDKVRISPIPDQLEIEKIIYTNKATIFLKLYKSKKEGKEVYQDFESDNWIREGR
jgi:hypothetical protein